MTHITALLLIVEYVPGYPSRNMPQYEISLASGDSSNSGETVSIASHHMQHIRDRIEEACSPLIGSGVVVFSMVQVIADYLTEVALSDLLERSSRTVTASSPVSESNEIMQGPGPDSPLIEQGSPENSGNSHETNGYRTGFGWQYH